MKKQPTVNCEFRVLYVGDIGGVDWQPVTEEKVRRALTGNYRDVDIAIRDLRNGLSLRTPFATYRHRDTRTGDAL